MSRTLRILTVTALCLAGVTLMLLDWHLTGLACGLVSAAVVTA